jgi:hypothetical protein
VDLGERHTVIKIVLGQEVDQLGQGGGLGLGPTFGVDPIRAWHQSGSAAKEELCWYSQEETMT